jgi:AcrR family transcriptional regulator
MASKKLSRRLPAQRRAHQTVGAILDAVIRILKREGVSAVTTNRIADVAGVSIGSVYQYFPGKHAIFEALHRRHMDQIDRVVAGVLLQHAASSLDTLVRALVYAMVEAHEADPELYDTLFAQVPHRAGEGQDFATRLHGVFLLAISARRRALKRNLDPAMAAFVVAHLVESLSHAAVLRRPAGISLNHAKQEAARAVLAYLHG